MTRLLLSALLMDVAFFCGWATVPFLVKLEGGLRLDDGQLGALRALGALTYVFGTLWLSRLWVGRDHAVVARLGAGLVAVCFVLASLATTPVMLFVWLAVSGVALSMFWPKVMSMVGEAKGRTLVERIARFNCWWSTGKAIAYVSAGVLLQQLDDPALTLRLSGLAIFGICVLVPPGEPTDRVEHELSSGEHAGNETMFRAALIGIFAAWFFAGVWENQFPEGLGRARLGAVFGTHYALWVNLLLSAMNFGLAFGFLALERWKAWPARRVSIPLAALGLAACQGVAMLSSSPVVIGVSLFLAGASFAVLYSQSLYHAQAGRSDKVRRSGIHEGVLWLGQLIGPPAAGYAVTASGRVEAAFELNLAVAAVCAVLIAFRLRARAA